MSNALFIVFATVLTGAASQYYQGWAPPMMMPAPYPWYPAPPPLLVSRANSAPMPPSQPNAIQDPQGGIPVPANQPPMRPSPSPLPMGQPTRPPGPMLPMRGMPPPGVPANVLSQIQAKRTAMLIARRRAMAAKLREEKKRKEAEAAAANANPFSNLGEAMMNFIKGSPAPGPLGSVMANKNRMSNAVASGCMSAVDTAENPMMSLIMPGGCDPKHDICPFTHVGRKCVEVSKGYGMCCPKSMTSGIIDIQGSIRRMNQLMELFGGA